MCCTAVSPDVKPISSAIVGAALGAAVIYAGYQAKQKRDGAAVIDLYNYIVEVSALKLNVCCSMLESFDSSRSTLSRRTAG